MGEHADKAKGKAKQATGKMTDDEKLRREGEKDEVKGQAKGAAKDVKRAVKDLENPVKK